MINTELRIRVFAVLKDYMGEEFTLSKPIGSVADLKDELINLNPSIESLLKSCRFAVNNTFVDMHYPLKGNDTIYVVPPSSGG